MIFKAYTLVDVTQTNARRHDAPKLVNQQANFNTFYNTIGLRTNATEFETFESDNTVVGLTDSVSLNRGFIVKEWYKPRLNEKPGQHFQKNHSCCLQQYNSTFSEIQVSTF